MVTFKGHLLKLEIQQIIIIIIFLGKNKLSYTSWHSTLFKGLATSQWHRRTVGRNDKGNVNRSHLLIKYF